MQIRRPDVAAVSGTAMALPEVVPDITAAELDAVLARSKSAAQLDAHLRHCERTGKVCSADDVDGIIRRAHGKDGRCNGNHAVVLAYYAQNHAHVFGSKDNQRRIARLLKEPDWTELMSELAAFMEKLHEEEREAARKREIEKERFEDDVLRPEEKRLALKKENGTAEERAAEREIAARVADDQKAALREASEAAIDDELTGSGKLELSGVELVTLARMKRGFANRE